jgi:hypothetical protein
MSNYIKGTNFTVKDTLPTGNSSKVVRGAEIDDELSAIASAISSKADLVSPTLTGTPAAPTASSGTNTTQIATTEFVTSAVSTLTGTLGTMSTQNKTSVDITGGTVAGTTITGATITGATITGGTISGITDLAVADGGTGLSSAGTSGNVLTSNGSAWVSLPPSGGQLQYAVFTSSGTWTCPTGVTRVFVWVVAGGTGAVRPGNGAYGQSGGANGISSWGYYTVVPGTAYTVTVGAGGTGVNTAPSVYVATSTSGGSSFGSFLTIGGSSITQSYETVSTSGGSITGAPFGGGTGVPATKPNLASRQITYKTTGNNSAVAWSTSDQWAAGSGGGFSGDTAIGGVGGGVYIEYIG